MSLSPTEQTTILALVAREGGLATFSAEVQLAMAIANQGAAISELAGNVTVAVESWPTVAAFIPTAQGMALFQIMQQIAAAVVANDATNLGPLFWALYGSVKAQQGL